MQYLNNDGTPMNPADNAKVEQRINEAAEWVRIEFIRMIDGLRARIRSAGRDAHGGDVGAILALGYALQSDADLWAKSIGCSFEDFKPVASAIIEQVKRDVEVIKQAEKLADGKVS